VAQTGVKEKESIRRVARLRESVVFMAPNYTFRFVQIEGLSERVDSSRLVYRIDWEIGHEHGLCPELGDVPTEMSEVVKMLGLYPESGPKLPEKIRAFT
jgi:hypothetical protein